MLHDSALQHRSGGQHGLEGHFNEIIGFLELDDSNWPQVSRCTKTGKLQLSGPAKNAFKARVAEAISAQI